MFTVCRLLLWLLRARVLLMANLSMYRVAMAKVRWRTDRAALRGGTYSFMINVYIYILK